MNILFVVPKFPMPILGGLENQAFILAKSIVKKGHKVFVFSGMFENNQKEYSEIEGVVVIRPRWLKYTSSSESKLSILSILRLILCFKSMINAIGKIDLVHFHSNSWLPSIIKFYFIIRGIHFISKVPSMGELELTQMKSGLSGVIRGKIMKKSTAIVALVPETVIELTKINYPAKRILKIPNGIDIKIGENDLNTRNSKNNDIIKVIFTGRLIKSKGVADLLYAWSIVLKRTNERLELNIFGDGPEKDDLITLSKTLNISESVNFKGHSNIILSELRESDIFVFPSYIEGNSNSILEAMMTGLPIISTLISGTKLQIGEQGMKYLFKPGEINNFAEILHYMIHNKSERISYGSYLYNRVEKVFNINKIADQYLQAYIMIKNDLGDNICEINKQIFEFKN